MEINKSCGKQLVEIQILYFGECPDEFSYFLLVTDNAFKNLEYIAKNYNPIWHYFVKKMEIKIKIINRNEYMAAFRIFNKAGVFNYSKLHECVKYISYIFIDFKKEGHDRAYINSIFHNHINDIDLATYFDIFDKFTDTGSGRYKYNDFMSAMGYVDRIMVAERKWKCYRLLLLGWKSVDSILHILPKDILGEIVKLL